MIQLSLYLFGTPQIEHKCTPVKLSQRKPLALLAYLGVTGTPHTREHLATLLWPETEQERALAYLRNALWQLNQTPIGAWVEADRETVTLRRGPDLYLDVVQFEQLRALTMTHNHAPGELCPACAAQLVQAVDIYRGDFMEGVTLEDSVSYDEWQFFQTEALRQAAIDAFEKLVRYYEQPSQGDPGKAVDYARRWLALDPYNESAHRTLMRLYAMTDQRTAALRQYETCVRALKEGFGSAPDKVTVALYQKLRSGELSAPPLTPPPSQIAPEHPPALQVHLPTSTMPFVGRREELAEVRRLLAQPSCRLLSLIGPGGIGKTRLALEAARGFAEDPVPTFADGIVMVSLAFNPTPEAALNEIAAALALAPVQRRGEHLALSRDSAHPLSPAPADAPALRQLLLDYLHDRSLLLILDNLEHLLHPGIAHEGTPAKHRSDGITELVETILHTSPGVRLLITTRERLNLLTEWVFTVSGMTLPPGNAAHWAESGAVRLFLQSAQRAMVGFEPTTEELNSIALICRLVEGFPLAIELAASWVRFLPCQEIADEIRASFDFLSSSLRDVPERHRSLRTIFEHSWTLLPREEAESFARLAIFPGGFTREAAREVTGSSLLILSALMDKSLLQQVASEPLPASGRYEMHTVLRQYAEAKLKLIPGAFEETAKRHAHYYLALLTKMEPALRGGGQRSALAAISAEFTNVRAAWLWAVDHRAVAQLRQAVVPLHLFCNLQGHFQEASRMFGAAIEALRMGAPDPADAGSRDQRALLGLLLVLQELHGGVNAPATSGSTAPQGMAMLQSLGPSVELALATLMWVSMGRLPDPEDAHRRLRETLDFYERRADSGGRADTLHLLGALTADRRDDYLEGEAYLEQSLRLHREIDDVVGTADNLVLLGLIADSRGMTELAEERHREALSLYRDLGDPRRPVTCLLRMGDLARRNGDTAKARAWLDEALSIARGLGDARFTAYVLSFLWMAAYDAEAYAEARQIAEEEVMTWQRVGATRRVAAAQQHLADALLALGELALARHYAKESLAILPENAWGLLALARISELEADDTVAFENYRKAIQLAQSASGLHSIPIISSMLKSMIGLSRLYARHGNAEKAAELMGLVLYQPTLHDAMRTEAEAILVDLLARHPGAAVDAARLGGETLDLDKVASELATAIPPFPPTESTQ
jgi:DNA-binding SARP family transcriptional activator/predicted ATPase